MAHAIHLVSTRAKLVPRREPYWGPRLDPGLYIGFRCTKDAGYWIARQYDASEKKQRTESLGNAAFKIYDDACADARGWGKRVLAGRVSKDIKTVKDACEAYVTERRQEKGDSMARECELRFIRHLYGTPLARVVLIKFRRSHLKTWRAGLVKGDGTPMGDASKNRIVSTLVAALNHAKSEGAASAETAQHWSDMKRLHAVSNTPPYLPPDQRKALIAALPEPMRPLVTAMGYIPMRPGAIAAFTADKIEPHTGQLHVGKDKNGKGRFVKLPDATRDWFLAQAKGKAPHALLFTQPDGQPWARQAWGEAIRDARVGLGLAPRTCAYSFRHSTITDLLLAGVPLLTVARIAGTSVAMIEKTYGHLLEHAATEALARLAL
ncbi:tyrosine-type recombinase/integrase [Dyella silvae]|uniref:tyrosine-type recombinase/integrase n=1 Tax=Dyella silvae TaxID=2994424 RepID=UPI002264BD95|nr:tyrosine-type recombinase/integrase [Dyella silvae]